MIILCIVLEIIIVILFLYNDQLEINGMINECRYTTINALTTLPIPIEIIYFLKGYCFMPATIVIMSPIIGIQGDAKRIAHPYLVSNVYVLCFLTLLILLSNLSLFSNRISGLLVNFFLTKLFP